MANRNAWITPSSLPAPTDTTCRRIRFRNQLDMKACITGALYLLTLPENWEQTNGVTVEQAVEAMSEMFNDYLDESAWCMIGAIVAITTDTAPEGTLLCDATTYNRVDYPRLYAAINPLYRLDADTFYTPDLRGRFVKMTGSDGGMANEAMLTIGGSDTVTLDVSQMPAHSHTNIPHAHGYSQPTFGVDIESVGVPDPTGVGNPPVPQITSSESIAIDSTGGDQAHDNKPPYIVLNYVIVAR